MPVLTYLGAILSTGLDVDMVYNNWFLKNEVSGQYDRDLITENLFDFQNTISKCINLAGLRRRFEDYEKSDKNSDIRTFLYQRIYE
jgi:hypothetical protein